MGSCSRCLRDGARELIVLDGVPIGEALARCGAEFATLWWHWFFLGNPAAEADRVINADPDAWYHSDAHRAQMGEAAWADYHRAIHDPATVRAMCEDYRAGLTVDREPARFSCSGPPATTWNSSTAIPSQSGGAGPTTCGVHPSSPATTWPRKRPTSWPRHSPASCDPANGPGLARADQLAAAQTGSASRIRSAFPLTARQVLTSGRR